MKYTLIVSLIFLSFFNTMKAQNVVLDPNPNLVIDAASCINVGEGRTLTFERSLACGPEVIISNDGGLSTIFSTSEETFSYTFEELGEYVIFCNAGPSNVAVTATCVIVEEAIPTLSEWGFIILSLILLIFGAVALRNTEVETAQ